MPISKNQKVELLKRIPLFAACSKAELIEVALIADEREAHAGDKLTEEGQPGREFFVLVGGAAIVQRRGRKLAELGPGDWFGEIAILTFKPRTATVTATSPVHLLVIQGPFVSRTRRDDAPDRGEGAENGGPAPRARHDLSSTSFRQSRAAYCPVCESTRRQRTTPKVRPGHP